MKDLLESHLYLSLHFPQLFRLTRLRFIATKFNDILLDLLTSSLQLLQLRADLRWSFFREDRGCFENALLCMHTDLVLFEIGLMMNAKTKKSFSVIFSIVFYFFS